MEFCVYFCMVSIDFFLKMSFIFQCFHMITEVIVYYECQPFYIWFTSVLPISYIQRISTIFPSV